MIEDTYELVKKEVRQDAQKKFPNWQEAQELYFSVHTNFFKEILESKIGGEEYFNRLVEVGLFDSASSEYLFDILQDEYSAYLKIFELKASHGEDIILNIMNSDCHDQNWSECLASIERYFEKVDKYGSNKPFSTPKGDNRYRVHQSIKLWVMNRPWQGDPEEGSTVGIVDQVERVIRIIEGAPGEYVRYQNEFYRIHSKLDFERLVRRAKKGEIYFFSNLHPSVNYINDIVPQEFICPE